MDALSHSLEAFCARGFHPMADGIAVEGMRLVAAHLEDATARGDDLDARSGMLAASLWAPRPSRKAWARCTRWRTQSAPHSARTTGSSTPSRCPMSSPAITGDREPPDAARGRPGASRHGYEAVQDWIQELRARLSIPHTVDALGVNEANLDMLAGGCDRSRRWW